MIRKLDTTYLFDPNVFEINLLEPHSDHHAYLNERNLEEKFNDGWKILYYENLNELINELISPKYDISKLQDVIVPLSVELQGYGKPQYTNTSYPFDGQNKSEIGGEITVNNPMSVYLKDFEYKKEKNLERFFINFTGFESALYLYVNGIFVGYSENLYLDSEFELTSYIKEGTNRIVAIVLKYSSSSWLLDQDFVRFSGIFRDVYVYKRPKNYIFDIDAKTNFINKKGILDLSFAFNSQNYQGDIKVEVFNEKEVLTQETLSLLKLYKGNNLHYEFDKVSLRSHETPNLYTLRITVLDNNIIYETKIGFRNVYIKKDILYFNDEVLKLYGINRHEWNPYTGRYLKEDDMVFDVKLLKANNINSSRCSHYPNISKWYELCDEYGINLIDECALESHGSFADHIKYNNELSLPGNNLNWEGLCVSKLRRMYERDKNHPSIIMYSLGNEAGCGAVFKSMRDYLKKRDPRALIHYEGVSIDEKYEQISDVYSRMYWSADKVNEFIKAHDDKPFMLCEFEHAMGNSLGNFDEYIKLFKTTNAIGGFVWDYIDQGLYYGKNETLHYGGDFDDAINDNCFNCNGVIFSDRKLYKKSSKLNHLKYCYQKIEFSYKNNTIEIVNNYNFKDTKDLYFEIEIIKNGIKVGIEKIEYNLKPKEKVQHKIQYNFDDQGEYFVNICAKFKENTTYANKNDVIAAEQFYVSGDYKDTKNSHNLFQVTEGHFYIEVVSNKISFLFRKHQSSLQLGGLTSIKFKGYEFLNGVVKPNIFRPNTDNDIGAKFNTSSSNSFGASKQLQYDQTETKYEIGENSFFITYRYYFKHDKSIYADVTYQIDNGKIRCDVDPHFQNIDYEIGTFELLFPLKNENQIFSYYGKGPYENYSDRKDSSFINAYYSSSKEEYMPYIRPQECGLHLETRAIHLKEGLFIRKYDKPFGFKLINYSPFDIECATHNEELKKRGSYLSIIFNSRGVGGDDSWGSDVHEPYKIHINDISKFSFYIEFGE